MEAQEYNELSKKTERIDWDDAKEWNILPLGVVGELGSLASVIKKHIRDKDAYSDYAENIHEEIGDVLWYLFAVARKMSSPILEWPSVSSESSGIEEAAYNLSAAIQGITASVVSIKKGEVSDAEGTPKNINRALVELGYISHHLGKSLGEVAVSSIDKNESFWSGNEDKPAECFDEDYEEYEKLPREFVIEFVEVPKAETGVDEPDGRKCNNELIIRMNGVQLGDRLTDNSWEDDGYRYHDIFHMAGVALLGWSPVFRRMLKAKRKSKKEVDEREDGARAAIIEEAVISQIYDYGAFHKFDSKLQSIDIDVIKNVRRMVRNYEVKKIKPWEWRHYMLSSYEIFREIHKGFSGKIKFNAEKREISIIENYDVEK